MRALTDLAMEFALAAGASFADIRIVERSDNQIYVARRSIRSIKDEDSFGFAVRVLKEGNWGFSSSTTLDSTSVISVTKQALAIAKASALAPKEYPVQLANEPTWIDERAGPCEEDPFMVSNREKADLLLSCCNTMMDKPDIVSAYGVLQFSRLRRIIANTEGSFLNLVHTFSHPLMGVTAVVGNESQSRQYQGGAKQAGFEFIREIDLLSSAPKWAADAALKCRADDSPVGIMDLVLDPMHLALTMHESVGHPTELDRILGWEANMAGRSFLTPNDPGHLQYGSELVNFTANSKLEGGLGSWFYDDDGVKMGSFPVVQNGKLVNLGMTRETAPIVGKQKSNGCCRADSFSSVPINRIPNLYMEAGTNDSVTKQSLIKDIEKGIYIEGQGSFSIDQMRNNFQFGGDMFWLIENGELIRPLKKVTYQAQTTDFWKSCDGVAGRKDWRAHGVMNCGKGEPMQVMYMTHGASHTRFRNIQVGGALK